MKLQENPTTKQLFAYIPADVIAKMGMKKNEEWHSVVLNENTVMWVRQSILDQNSKNAAAIAGVHINE